MKTINSNSTQRSKNKSIPRFCPTVFDIKFHRNFQIPKSKDSIEKIPIGSVRCSDEHTFRNIFYRNAYIKFPSHGFKKQPTRSEEHTSELQSRGHLVCSLLLE